MSDPPSGTFVTAGNLERGENPWCHLEWLSKEGLTQPSQLMMVRATMEAGKAHRFHLHPHREEIIYVVSGVATQWIEREPRELKPGDIAHIPAGVVHATFNHTDAPLVFLAILSPVEAPGEFTVDVWDDEPWNQLG